MEKERETHTTTIQGTLSQESREEMCDGGVPGGDSGVGFVRVHLIGGAWRAETTSDFRARFTGSDLGNPPRVPRPMCDSDVSLLERT